MEAMTKEWLAIWLADEFHDWIDGDDPVSQYNRYTRSGESYVEVVFESGAAFKITIEEI